MSKLNIDQKTIKSLFSDKKADFLIPDYQRPYAWGETECQTLWEDLFAFAFPENKYGDPDPEKFNQDEEYYLGPIVTFKNEKGQLEVIDGQQRLTTLMLLLRAFYSKFGKMNLPSIRKLKESIEQCIWKLDEEDEVLQNELKISSDVATDGDKHEFLDILKLGEAKPSDKSLYATNYLFFQKKIDKYKDDYPEYFSKLPKRIIDNCILLPIEAESQDTALRIFSTLNDRGKPLSDADIFKAQFYKYFSAAGKKDSFIKEWKKLEELCESIFHPIQGTPMDDLFTRYMYYERAKQGIKSSTTEALRKFYERNSYALLKNEDTFENLKVLADFWKDVNSQAEDRFSQRVLRQLFMLNYAPNSMWTFFVSVYFLKNKDAENKLDDEKFYKFLQKAIAFIWCYAVTNPGLNALRTPVFAEMVNIIEGKDIDFANFIFPYEQTRSQLENYNFYNGRPITRSMLVWWAMNQDGQELPSLTTSFDIEHIYARNRYEHEKSLSNPKMVDAIGNKSILERKINIRASDYRFTDKRKYYIGYETATGQKKAGTDIVELKKMADYNDFSEKEIVDRTNDIFTQFCNYLKEQNLMH